MHIYVDRIVLNEHGVIITLLKQHRWLSKTCTKTKMVTQSCISGKNNTQCTVTFSMPHVYRLEG